MQALSEDKAAELIKGMNIPPQPQIIADLQLIQYSPDPSVADASYRNRRGAIPVAACEEYGLCH